MTSPLRENLAIGSIWAKGVLAAGALMAALLMAGLAASPAHAFSTFIVNSTGDIGDATPDGTCDTCTLREAIQEANDNNNPSQTDQINFNISGTGVHTISPTSPLPDITEPVVINGYTQPGSSANTLAKGTNAKLLIEINGTNAGGSAGGLFIAASDSVVKGLVINRFLNTDAIDIDTDTSADPTDVVTNVRIEGNFLGTNPSGTIARSNGGSGVFISDGSYNTIGGTSPAVRNLISANNFEGVLVEATGSGDISVGNKIQGNLIGTQKDGIQALSNGEHGVRVLGFGAFGNRILSNSISSNGGLGIDLADSVPTPNDSGDTDSGPNSLQNFPVLSSAKTVSGKSTIKGKLNSRPGATYTIQFFSNPSGNNEGSNFIGQKVVSTNANGNASFTFSPKNAVAVGQTITATATMNTTGDTSEFSAAREVVSS